MGDLAIVYEGNMPDEVRRQVEDCLDEFARFAPHWLVSLFVQWDSSGAESVGARVTAVTHTRDCYREADLTVYPRWQDHAPLYRRETVLHEIFHTHVAPLHTEANDIVESLTEEGSALRAYMLRRVEKVVEAVVQDLAVMAWRNFVAGPPPD